MNEYLKENEDRASTQAGLILNNVRQSVNYFKRHGKLERSIITMGLNKHDDGRVNERVYLTIWSKIYAEIRF